MTNELLAPESVNRILAYLQVDPERYEATPTHALLDALAEPERYIRHFMKRLRKGVRLNHTIICAPQTDALAASPLYAVPCADSS